MSNAEIIPSISGPKLPALIHKTGGVTPLDRSVVEA